MIVSIYSTKNHEDLVLYADGPCKNYGISPLKVRVNFHQCHCPIGFEQLETVKDRCVCVCHNKLLSLPFMKDLHCNSTTLTITRNKEFWISIMDTTLIVYAQCPADYCHPPLPPIDINLNKTNGADVQCKFNRSGTLCGQCQEGLTLSLGSSRCLECSVVLVWLHDI